MMQDAIKHFPEQFLFEPKIIYKNHLKKKKRIVLLGMGGSHLGADIVQSVRPDISLIVHSNYGLPALSKKELSESLIIASSYSGNTEEVIDGVRQAQKLNLSIAVISIGGKLLDIAQKKKLPYIQLPDTGIQPRSALGFNIIALLALMKEQKELENLRSLAVSLKPKSLSAAGNGLARRLKDSIPIIYTSAKHQAIAYNWKIKFNETGKIPAFYNVFPELNHNEMTGFDVAASSKHLSKQLYFLFLTDSKDHPKIQKRMKVMMTLYKKRGLRVHEITLQGKSPWEKVFRSLLLADWAAVYTAKQYGLEAEQVPMVEEFKKMIA